MQLTDGEHLLSLVDSAPIGICILDAITFKAEAVNEKFLKIAGKFKAEIVGKWFWEPFAEVRQYYEGALAAVSVTGEVYYAHQEELVLSRDRQNEWIYASFVFAPVKSKAEIVSKIAVWFLENAGQLNDRQKIRTEHKQLIEANADMRATNDKLFGLNRQLVQTNENINQLNLRLQESETDFKRLVAQAPVPILVFRGPDLVIDLANQAMLDLLGRDSSIIGRPLLEGLPEIKEAPAVDKLFHVFRTGKAYDGNEEPVPIETNGQITTRYFNFSYSPLTNNGKIVGVMDIAIEVTAQVRARKDVEASEMHFRYLADLVPAKISNALPSGEVTFFNQKWLDYAGMNFEDLRDFGYHQMMHPDEIPTFQMQLAEAAAESKPLESEMRFKDINGNYRWHLNIASPILNEHGEITMWVGSTTDIQRIKEEEQRKSDFIGMVSHELKTPLTSLNGYLQVLQAKIDKLDDSFAQRSLEQSLKQVKKMTGMINGFLNVSRLESGKIAINKTNFEMQDLFTEVKAETEQLMSSHTIVFACLSSAPIFADRDKIGQVLTNLISNASKYSDYGTTIDVSCRIKNEQIEVAVTDHGLGISQEDLNHVFERYYRAERNTHVSGFGIGLYLSAEIINRHEGRIWAESEIGKGSIFYFSLPLNK